MFRHIAVLGAIALVLYSCSEPVSSNLTSAGASTSPAPTGTPPHACAGFDVPLMLIHIAPDGSSSGDLLDTNAGNAVTRTYRLAWPEGYSVRTEGGVPLLVDTAGHTAARDGSMLADVQVCPDGDLLMISEPIVLASSSP